MYSNPRAVLLENAPNVLAEISVYLQLSHTCNICYICASIVSKVESEPKHEEDNIFGGFFFKTKNTLFRG